MSTMIDSEEGRALSSTVVENRDQLVAYIESGSKPRENWRIGTEHEKFGFNLETLQPIPYDGPAGVKAMFDGLERFGWQPVVENGFTIAMHMEGQTISLEPGGQFELSGAPLKNLHETCTEVNTHLDQVKQVAAELGIGFIGMGFHPTATRADFDTMPKARYDIMKAYMPTKGSKGLDMMFRTCTVQVNLDFGSEKDMREKFRVGMALQPVATALFANSPFKEGKTGGMVSLRSDVWTDTDPDRCGNLPFVFDDGFGFERYVDYALDVPMYFVFRDGKYINTAGQSFRDFLAGKLPGYSGHKPTLKDWDNHLTTVFTEVRMKKFLEMRGADGGPWARICALPAIWVGLLYDQPAQNAALDLVKTWTAADVDALRAAVPTQGFAAATPDGRTVREVAADMLTIAEKGLGARAREDQMGQDERHFLGTLKHMVAEGRTLADEMMAKYEGEWAGDVTRVFAEYAY
ncbi:MAG: glutamate--cysteine ligase [Minwuia sp.]|uniref:glutamate--cysteine ligase n=1 Tax=Minwuia sp. TaxID=2493630 RepID=UPI003A8AD3A5